jgi:hypothetical protein
MLGVPVIRQIPTDLFFFGQPVSNC